MRSVGQYETAARTLQRRCEQQLAYEEQRMAAMAAASARRRLEAERQRVELKQRSQLDRLAARMQVNEPFSNIYCAVRVSVVLLVARWRDIRLHRRLQRTRDEPRWRQGSSSSFLRG